MISAPPMNGVASGHGHPHGHGMPMHNPARSLGQLHRAMENERMCMDAQKFLVPSLPVSLRSGTVSDPSAGKRSRERSILNGTVLPPDSNNNSYSTRQVGLDRVRRPVPFPYLNGPSQGHSPGQGKGVTTAQVMASSPRKVERIPTYNGKTNGVTTGGGSTAGDRNLTYGLQQQYPHHHHHHQMPSNPAHFHPPRSSMPIPCSSPAPASSASPKAMSPSTHHNGVAPSHYSPQLPGSDLNSGHYPGGYPHHPSMGLAPSHTAAFYAAAAAAAAASHSIPYPLFGSSFPLSHAAASSYLDNFHSNILAQQQQQHQQHQQQQQHQMKKVAAASPSPPSRAQGMYYSQHSKGGYLSTPAMSPSSSRQDQTTSERYKHGQSASERYKHDQSVSERSKHDQTTTERYNGNGYGHSHSLQHHPRNGEAPLREMNGHYPAYPVCSGLSKGGPLGMGHMDMANGFMVPRLPLPGNSTRKLPAKESLKSTFSISQSCNDGSTKNKVSWSERPPSPSAYINTPPSHMTVTRSNAREVMHHHHESTPRSTAHPPVAHQGRDWDGSTVKVRPRSPDSPGPNSAMVQRILNTSIFDFPRGRSASPPRQGCPTGAGHGQVHAHHHSVHAYEPSRDQALDLNTKTRTTAVHHQTPFLTPSPKKPTNSQYWDMTISPTTSSSKKSDPPHSYVPTSGGTTMDYAKYLTQFPKPSNYSASSTTTTSSIYLRPSTAQIPPVPPPAHASNVPASPTVPTSRYSTFPTRFTFTPPRAGGTSGQSTGDAKPTTPTVLITPVSKQMMPELLYFKRGSRIELGSGQKMFVEDLREQDFINSAELDGGVKILRCTLLSIDGQELIGVDQNSFCKLILRVEGQENKEVSIHATPEQPFFVEGRGWSSLSPIASQILLQLNCFHLQVGDVCLTLTRADNGKANTPPGFATSPTLNAILKRNLGDNNGNLSPRVMLTAHRINKPVSILTPSSKISNYRIKGPRREQSNSPASPGGAGIGKSNKSGYARSKLSMASIAMLPPPVPIPAAVAEINKSTENIPPTSVLTIEIPSSTKPIYPLSPKKRRWSAPPAECRNEGEGPSSPKKSTEDQKMD